MIDENNPTPIKLTLHKKSRTLEIEFDTNEIVVLSFSLLRASSLSAEMRHGLSKHDDFKNVTILAIEPVGNYAIKPIFSDGHRTGIFSWHTLYELGQKQKGND